MQGPGAPVGMFYGEFNVMAANHSVEFRACGIKPATDGGGRSTTAGYFSDAVSPKAFGDLGPAAGDVLGQDVLADPSIAIGSSVGRTKSRVD